ncbi:hypothetical protein [Lysobacter humi (ex Lee et al. 2017)]
MRAIDPVTRSLTVTDAALRAQFPDDYYKRCMYAAFGVATLLGDAGIDTQVAGGDFLCAVVSRDGRQLSLQGFGTTGNGEASHYWVATSDEHIDLGLAYLPIESPFPAAALPALRWSTRAALPAYMAYRERMRFEPDAVIEPVEIGKRMAAFIDRCRAIRDSGQPLDRLPYWHLRDMQALRFAAQKRDPWAMAALTFLSRGLRAQFPPS